MIMVHYRQQLRRFMFYLEQSGENISLPDRYDKLQEEILELGNAQGRDEKVKEIADCLNVLFSMMDMLEVEDPLADCFDKLVSTEAKYRAKKAEQG
jgi:hypothetical protein